MKTWLRALAWRLVGFRLLPLGPGDLVIVHVNFTTVTKGYADFIELLQREIMARGARMNILPHEVAITVLQNRATPAAAPNQFPSCDVGPAA